MVGKPFFVVLVLVSFCRALQFDALHRWVDASAGSVRQCRAAETPGTGRGLVASVDLAPGAVGLEVPFSACLIEPDDGSGSVYGRLASRLMSGASRP